MTTLLSLGFSVFLFVFVHLVPGSENFRSDGSTITPIIILKFSMKLYFYSISGPSVGRKSPGSYFIGQVSVLQGRSPVPESLLCDQRPTE